MTTTKKLTDQQIAMVTATTCQIATQIAWNGMNDFARSIGGINEALIDAAAKINACADPDDKAITSALQALLDHYVRLVNSGDAGNWDPETEPVVIAARAALAPKARP